jgi:hypothetical protein
MKNYKCALEIMKQELNNKYVSPEIKYAIHRSIRKANTKATSREFL